MWEEEQRKYEAWGEVAGRDAKLHVGSKNDSVGKNGQERVTGAGN